MSETEGGKVVMNDSPAPSLAAPEGAAAQAQPEAGGQPAATGTPFNPSPSASGTPAAGTPATGPSAEPLFEIKVDGKVEKVTKEELILRAQRDTDYTGKTQKLAEARRAFETDRQRLVQEEVERARQTWIREQAEATRREADARLREENPAQAALQVAHRTQQMLEDQTLDLELKRARGQFPDVSENDLLLEAQRQGISRPEQFGSLISLAEGLDKVRVERMEKWLDSVISEGKHIRLGKYKDEIIAAYLKEKELKPGPLAGSGGSPVVAAPPRRAKTLDEAQDMANELMGVGAPPA